MSILNIFENKKLKEEFNTLQENYSLLEQKIKQKESEINSIKVDFLILSQSKIRK